MKIKIRETARAKKGWSLYKLANELQLPQQTVYGWQSGRTQPRLENIDRLCSVLGCSVGDLFEAEPVEVSMNKELFWLTFRDGSHILAHATCGNYGTFEKKAWVNLDGTPVKENPYGVQRGGFEGKIIPYEPLGIGKVKPCP
jgi:transcriptional regulator with XRE-family HTH domain